MKYRMLEKGEITKAGDQVTASENKTGGWMDVYSIHGPGREIDDGLFSGFRYRRPIPTPRKAKAGKMPKGCDKCPLYGIETNKLVCYGTACKEIWRRLRRYFGKAKP